MITTTTDNYYPTNWKPKNGVGSMISPLEKQKVSTTFCHLMCPPIFCQFFVVDEKILAEPHPLFVPLLQKDVTKLLVSPVHNIMHTKLSIFQIAPVIVATLNYGSVHC